MSIRFPHELAAAAEFAERAVETAPVATDATMAVATFDLGLAGDPIRLAVGPGFMPAGAARKPIPGQTYH